MTPLESVVLIVALALPFAALVHWHLRGLTDPRCLRDHGVVIAAERVLEHRSAPIGVYMGRPIWGSVTFMGMRYRFDHVIDAARRERIRERELYLEPGLVYVTD